MKNLLFFLLLGGLLVMGCSKDCEDFTNPACSNYDPCYGITPTSAEFDILCPANHAKSKFFYGDTLSGGGFLFFKAKEDLDSYEWYIGSHSSILTEQEVFLNFGEYEGWLIVTLIGRKKVINDCFTYDTEVDTVTKSVFIAHRDSSLLPGFYTGYCKSAPNDTFSFKYESFFLSDKLLSGPSQFPKGCFWHEPINASLGTRTNYRQFLLSSSDAHSIPCARPRGFGELSSNNTLTITYEYSYLQDNGSIIMKQDTFVGKKIR